MLEQSNTMCYTTRSIDYLSQIRDVDGMITAHFRVPADSIWFDGHFPGVAVLPGIAQLAAVVDVLSAVLKRPVRVTDVSRVRFKLAISPAEPILVQITPKEKDALTYGFRLLKGQEMACSGFLKVAVDTIS